MKACCAKGISEWLTNVSSRKNISFCCIHFIFQKGNCLYFCVLFKFVYIGGLICVCEARFNRSVTRHRSLQQLLEINGTRLDLHQRNLAQNPE